MTKLFIIISKITTLADIANDKSRLGLRTENSYIRLRPRSHTRNSKNLKKHYVFIGFPRVEDSGEEGEICASQSFVGRFSKLWGSISEGLGAILEALGIDFECLGVDFGRRATPKIARTLKNSMFL